VISGAVHVGLIAVMILLFGARAASTKPPEKVVSTSVEKDPDPPAEDLTNEDLGLQADLEAALPELERVDKQTVDAAVTQDNLGQPNALDTNPTALAVPGLDVGDVTNPGLAGDAGNILKGEGGGGGNVNASFVGRSGATKSQLLRAGGGNAASEQAVALGLAWLARQQKQDGGWEFDGTSKDERIAATGMALLPFLAAGETHTKGKKYQKTVASGLAFLLRHCALSGANAGRMSNNMYAHAIGTMALCEAYGMSKDKGLLLTGAQASINFIQRAQAPDGGWRYSPNSPAGDTSVVGWMIQALTAGKLSRDIVVDDKVIKRAVGFLDKVSSGSRKAVYGYTGPNGGPGTAMTAVGLLCRYYIDGWGPDNAGMAEGVLNLSKHGPTPGGKINQLYYYYYATQVVHFFEGEEWKTWNEGPKQADGTRKGGMRDWLVTTQDKKPGANLGSWDSEGGNIGGHCGRLGTTAMCLLTLEVYYRHLPLYKRKTDDGALKIVDNAK
jgi:hypothetical protein